MARHANLGQQIGHAGARHSAAPLQAKADIARHRQMREQREILKHQANATRLGRHAGHRVTDQSAIDVD